MSLPRSESLLLLDIDETLVHAADVDDPIPPVVDFHALGQYPVMKRPFLGDFLGWCFNSVLFKTAFWSAGGELYVGDVLKNILDPKHQPEFVFTHAKCTRTWNFLDPYMDDSILVKDLKKVRAKGWDLRRVLALDDMASVHQRAYGNHVPIRPFRGSLEDEELRRVIPFLERWFREPNVRAIEKRFW